MAFFPVALAVAGLSLRDEHFYNGSLILYVYSPSLAGGGAFIEECTVTFMGRNFPNISLNPVTG